VAKPGAAWIYSVWGAGIAVSLIVVTHFYVRREGESLRPNFALLRRSRRAVASHAAVNLSQETADLAMPIVVVTLLSPADNAGFYIAWLVVGSLVMIPLSLSMVAYAISSADAARLGERFRFTFASSLALLVLANLVLIPCAAPILAIFGAGYADTATTAFHVLALGVFPLTFKQHYVALHRVHHTLDRALPIVWGGTVLELGGGAVGATLGGIAGLAWGWLAGLLLEAFAMSGDVLRGCTAASPARRLEAPGRAH
jgi:hypothetical protein